MRRLRTWHVVSALLTVSALGWAFWLRSLPEPPSPMQFVLGPKSVIATGHAEAGGHRWSNWATVEDVSGDGTEILVGVHKQSGNIMNVSSRCELWSTSGTEVTPSHWKDPQWERLLNAPPWENPQFWNSLSTTEGRRFSRDGQAWSALCNRQSKSNLNVTSAFPTDASFSSDARFLAYSPVKSEHEDKVIEEVATGRRIATLSGVAEPIVLAPHGQTAVTYNHRVEAKEGEQPYLVLWDLKRSIRRAELLIPDYSGLCRISFSEDGRYVFAYYHRRASAEDFGRRVRWWDTGSGKRCGETKCDHASLLDSGRMLVAITTSREYEPYGKSAR